MIVLRATNVEKSIKEIHNSVLQDFFKKRLIRPSVIFAQSGHFATLQAWKHLSSVDLAGLVSWKETSDTGARHRTGRRLIRISSCQFSPPRTKDLIVRHKRRWILPSWRQEKDWSPPTWLHFLQNSTCTHDVAEDGRFTRTTSSSNAAILQLWYWRIRPV